MSEKAKETKTTKTNSPKKEYVATDTINCEINKSKIKAKKGDKVKLNSFEAKVLKDKIA